MQKSVLIALGFALTLGGIGLTLAQEKRASPHDTASATIGGKKITIEYGRPYKKGRAIFGGLVPYNAVWRTGADEATIFKTDGDLMVGDMHVPAGSYSLFTIPKEDQWTLVLNKIVKQWGAFNYDAKQDFGRTAMKVEKASPTDQFTVAIEAKGGPNGLLRMSWDTTSATVPIMVH
jgi:hypothetical protein